MNKAELSEAMKNCKFVYHTASAGMTGPGQLNKKLCYSVNIDGTQYVLNIEDWTIYIFRNVLDCCLEHEVRRLVYTSSYNAVFSTKALPNCDESVPYPEDKEQLDYYSLSKKKSEILVLKYDNTIYGEYTELVNLKISIDLTFSQNRKYIT